MELKDLLRMVKKRLWLIIGFVLIATITTAVYNSKSYQPFYAASTKLVVNKTVEQDQLGKEQMDLGAIGINIRLINTYTEIIRTPAIMDKVVQRYPDLGLSAEQLMNMIQVSALKETQVMTLSTVDISYERAAKVVNAVTEVFQTEIPKIMKVDNIAILHMAQPMENPVPLNRKTNQYLAISFAASLLIALGISFLLEFMDDTLKKEEDVRKLFGVPNLAVITRYKSVSKHIREKPDSNQVGDVHVAVKR